MRKFSPPGEKKLYSRIWIISASGYVPKFLKEPGLFLTSFSKIYESYKCYVFLLSIFFTFQVFFKCFFLITWIRTLTCIWILGSLFRFIKIWSVTIYLKKKLITTRSNIKMHSNFKNYLPIFEDHGCLSLFSFNLFYRRTRWRPRLWWHWRYFCF